MVDFLTQFLQKQNQNMQQPTQPIDQSNIEMAVQQLEQPPKNVEGFVPLPEIESREMLANSLLQTASDRSVHPLARGLSAYFGRKQLMDVSSERAKTEQGLAEIQQRQKQQAIRDARLFEQEQSAVKFDRDRQLQQDKLSSQEKLEREKLGFQKQKFKDEQVLKEKEFELNARKFEKDLESGGLTNEDIFDRSTKLRGEYIKGSKDFIMQRDALGRLEEALNRDSAAGDIAAVFSFMKIQDPTSVVREGEFATAQNAAGIPDRIRAAYNKALTGERLLPELRKDFRETSKQIFNAAQRQHDKRTSTYKNLALKAGADPEQVTIDFNQAEQIAQEEGIISKPENKESQTFRSIEDAEAANLPIGTEIIINGRRAIIE